MSAVSWNVARQPKAHDKNMYIFQPLALRSQPTASINHQINEDRPPGEGSHGVAPSSQVFLAEVPDIAKQRQAVPCALPNS